MGHCSSTAAGFSALTRPGDTGQRAAWMAQARPAWLPSRVTTLQDWPGCPPSTCLDHGPLLSRREGRTQDGQRAWARGVSQA